MYKTINIKVDDESIHLYYLTVINSLIGSNSESGFKPDPLTTKELELYSEILKINQKFISLSPEARAEYIHSNTVRKSIRTKLDTSVANYNNVLSRLSSKITLTGQKLYNLGAVPKDFENIHNYEGIQYRLFREKV